MAISSSQQILFSSIDTVNAVELGLEALAQVRPVLAALTCLVNAPQCAPESVTAATGLCRLGLALLADYEEVLADMGGTDLPMPVSVAYASAVGS